jgi:hypothetical protein
MKPVKDKIKKKYKHKSDIDAVDMTRKEYLEYLGHVFPDTPEGDVPMDGYLVDEGDGVQNWYFKDAFDRKYTAL